MAGNNGPVRLEETVSGMSWTDSAKQYSEERHRETLESVQDARRARQDLDTKATEYWYDHDRDIAQAMGTQPSPLLAKAYDALLLFGINLYRRDAKNAMGKLRREAKKVDAEISQIEKRLTGRATYVPPVLGILTEEELEQRRYVRERDKGLRYRLSETLDEARRLGYEYRSGQAVAQAYKKDALELDSQLDTIHPDDPSKASKIAQLQAKRSEMQRKEDALLVTQREYEQELLTHEKKIDILQAKIGFYECITSKGRSKFRQIEAGIDILDDYIRDRDDFVTVNELLAGLVNLDTKHIHINDTIAVYDQMVHDQLGRLTHLNSSAPNYARRPLMKNIYRMGQHDKAAADQDMARIMTKIGISYDTPIPPK